MEIENWEHTFNLSELYSEDFNSSDVLLSEKDETYGFGKPIPKAVHIIFVAIVFLAGFIGNTFVCLTIARRKQMQTAINLILLSLTVGDFVMLITEFIQITFIEGIDFKFSKTVCSILIYVIMFNAILGAIQITVPLVIDTFYQQASKKRAVIIIDIIWLVALVISIPHGLSAAVLDDDSGMSFCLSDWQVLNFEKLGDVIELLTFLIPIIVLLISLFVNKVFIRKPIKKLFASLIAVYLIFVIPLMISFCLTVLFLFNNFRIQTQILITQISYLIFKLTLVYKPILYILFDAEFKREFKSIFTRRFEDNFVNIEMGSE